MLEHLPAREQVLEKLVRALRSGGWLVVESVDYVSAVAIGDYGAADHEHVQAMRLRMFEQSGVDHTFGRRLPGLLRNNGLTNVANGGRV